MYAFSSKCFLRDGVTSFLPPFRVASVQVNLEHHVNCVMEDVARKDHQAISIPLEELEQEWARDIKMMTSAGVPIYVLYRYLASSIAPRKLGPKGVQKVMVWEGLVDSSESSPACVGDAYQRRLMKRTQR